MSIAVATTLGPTRGRLPWGGRRFASWWPRSPGGTLARAVHARRVPRSRTSVNRGAGGADLAAITPLPVREPRPADLAELFQQRYEVMVRVAYGILGSSQLAEEAVQDAFVEVHRRWDRIDEPAAYLRRAVVNRATSLLRRRIVEQRHARPRPEVSEDRPDEMRDAIMALAPRYRAAILLRYYEDLPDQAIAMALGVRPATVRSLLHRAVQQLREAVT